MNAKDLNVEIARVHAEVHEGTAVPMLAVEQTPAIMIAAVRSLLARNAELTARLAALAVGAP